MTLFQNRELDFYENRLGKILWRSISYSDNMDIYSRSTTLEIEIMDTR